MNERPKVAVVDIGSTSVKAAYGDLQTINKLAPITPLGNRVDYASRATVELIEGRSAKHVPMSAITEPLSSLTEMLERGDDVGIVVITGLTHTLVVHRQDRGLKNAKIILSDPALQLRREDLPPAPVQPASANMKLRTLRRYPNVVHHLVGTDTEFEDLGFTSILGATGSFISQQVFPESPIEGVPRADLRSFAGGHGKGMAEVEKLKRELNIRSDQLSIHGNDYVSREARGGKVVIYFVNDFQANAFIVNMLIEKDQIPANAIVIETDSVGKLLTKLPDETQGFGNLIEGLTYTTQRRTAGINPDVLHWLITSKHRSAINYYKFAESMVKKGLGQKNNPYYYFPDAYSDAYPYGRLIWWDGDRYFEIPLYPGLAQIYEADEVAKMVAAIAKGVCFGLRQKIEKIAMIKRESLSSVPVFIYGGLATYSPAFKRLLKQCVPNELYHLRLPGTAAAAAFVACIKTQMFDVGNFSDQIPIRKIPQPPPSEVVLDRTKEYEHWTRLAALV